MKLKNLLFIAILGFLVFSCGDDSSSSTDDYDAEKYALEDDKALIEYLETHYLNESDGGIYTIKGNETPLMDQTESQVIMKNDVKFRKLDECSTLNYYRKPQFV